MRRQAFGLVGSAKGRTADGSNQRFEARHLKGDLFPFKSTDQNLQRLKYRVPQVVEERLIEIDYGPYEGMDLAHLTNEVISFFHDTANVPAPVGMEALPDLIARTGAFLSEIRDEARDKNILLSTHAIAMKGALEYLTPDSHGSYWSTFVPNCAVYTTCVLPDGSYAVPYRWEMQ